MDKLRFYTWSEQIAMSRGCQVLIGSSQQDLQLELGEDGDREKRQSSSNNMLSSTWKGSVPPTSLFCFRKLCFIFIIKWENSVLWSVHSSRIGIHYLCEISNLHCWPFELCPLSLHVPLRDGQCGTLLLSSCGQSLSNLVERSKIVLHLVT